ncbi:putative cytoplasmic protein [Vibrio ishigakensis]|uniref:Putative cytoplasmic protein n=1 Tax=Vibrio ishigakensis TaxID=1481914 RepID=A0A0B8P1W2_9VIBR|nr:putative cytoplasmic protein [Vibrio ishigakensis]
MLSIAQAKKLALLSQGLPPKRTSSALEAFERMGYVQIDTISVVQRAHHHVLWSRSPGYRPEHLDELVSQKKVFEYWSHAASYLPMRDYRFTLRRKQAIKSGEQKHWFTKNPKLMSEVLARIKAESIDG